MLWQAQRVSKHVLHVKPTIDAVGIGACLKNGGNLFMWFASDGQAVAAWAWLGSSLRHKFDSMGI
ncbi:hypothetical protein GCM10009660_61270 [Catellatospora bangladeshensis]|uniref:Uncharacterized protein n=1 Tax=Brevibacterium picturae TaxID=260553 RepID=A0ABN2CVC1_9MICO